MLSQCGRVGCLENIFTTALVGAGDSLNSFKEVAFVRPCSILRAEKVSPWEVPLLSFEG